jgi:hypothetical protein
MRNLLVPAVLLILLPALYLGWRLELLGRRAVRWMGGGMLVLLVALSLPYDGVDFLYIKRMNLLIAAAVALLMLLRGLKVSCARDRGVYRTSLYGLAALSIVVYLNFFSFHGERTFVHLHDVAHYYLASKYKPELGYGDLYTAMLRAEAEVYDDHFEGIEARDLETYELVHIRTLLRRSDPVKDAFTPWRWADFKQDVSYFRESMGDLYAAVLRDHGFNATPVWSLAGTPLANLVPAGNGRGILLLTLLDPLLLVGLIAAIGWTFGRETMLLAVIHFCVIFGATFGWTGGAFLRYLWLFALVCGICCLRRRWFASAGALLAAASLLRVFPVFFMVPLLFKAVAEAWRRRSLPRRYGRLFGSFAVTAGVLIASTGLLPRGWGHWPEFGANLATHVETISPNLVGLNRILAYKGGPERLTAGEFRAMEARRARIHHGQLWAVFLPLLVVVAWMARRRNDLAASALALPLLFTGLNLAAYYYVVLLLLVLVHRRSPERLALIFTAEAASYTLLLFEDRDAILYIYRSVVVLVLLVSLHAGAFRRAFRGLSSRSTGDGPLKGG